VGRPTRMLSGIALYGVRTFLERVELARDCLDRLDKVILARGHTHVKQKLMISLAQRTVINLLYADDHVLYFNNLGDQYVE
jgi:hypothetical protein